MRITFIAIIILILTVYAYLRFQPGKHVETPVLVPPVATPTPDVPIEKDNIDRLPEEQKLLWEQFEPSLKRSRVYAGELNVLPPCPKDTHEEKGFCRKGASRDDTNIRFIGGRVLEIDVGCRPDQCDVQCKKACEDAAGEACTLSEDISAECLKKFPPEEQTQDEAELREQGIQCRSRHDADYQHYRCRYSTSEHEQFRNTRTASDEECRKMYDTYLKCMAALPERKMNGKAYAPGEAEMRCMKILNEDFIPARCEVGWTSEPDRHPFGRSVADQIFCTFTCF